MRPRATTGQHRGTYPSPLARVALTCALSAQLALSATGALGAGVAFADTPADAAVPITTQEPVVGTPVDAAVPVTTPEQVADSPADATVPITTPTKVAGTPVRITRRMAVTSEEQALKIALRYLGLEEAKVDEIDYEHDEKPYHWEVELTVGDVEYEIEISPYTGAILSRSWKRASTNPHTIVRLPY